MTMSNSFYGYSLIMTFFMQLLHAWSQLTPNFYDKTCPNLQNIVRNEVQTAFNKENRMAASLLRLHFHDCFVNGCDGSVLLDVSGGEKFALSNLNSVRGFEVVDRIKSTVESACPGVVSCADILALVARDSVVISRGKSWTVLLGRRDGNVSISINGTDAALPSAFDTLDVIISKFKRVGLDEKDVVSLSGSHTIGLARCAAFSNRLFNYSGTGLPDRSMDRNLLSQLQKLCKDDQSLPSAFDSLYNITSKFKNVGLDLTDVVSLSGSHTIGLARCAAFNNRLFNFSATGLPDSSMDTNMLLQLQALCGNASSHGYSADPNLGNSTTPLDRDSTNDFVTITFRTCSMERPYLVPTKSQLTPYFYERTCPNLLNIVRYEVEKAFFKEIRMAASLLRLHFHDCFVNGCDGSILLDVSDGEKVSFSNLNSVRGFEVVDDIKRAVEYECSGVVSCADILAIVARDSVVITGGPTWNVLLGRRDGFVSSKAAANISIPSAFDSLYNIIAKFKKVGLDVTDVVSLSGSHTIGLARCAAFNNRLFNFEQTGRPDSSMDEHMLFQLQLLCPNVSSYSADLDSKIGNFTTPLDRDSPIGFPTNDFDNHYFQNLLNRKALLSSDQVLLNSYETKRLIQDYSISTDRFFDDFAKSMVKMGNISPPPGSRGQIRKNCRRVN
uniref:peroxidase n=1 Tax=Quercus lobata TaxID=97700 RepID=A0A7N2KLI7_QUELO